MTEEEMKDILIKVCEITKATQIIKEYKELTKQISPENAIGRFASMDSINNKSVAEACLW